MTPSTTERQSVVITINGHSWVHDSDVSQFVKENYGERCHHCGAASYAHQINVLETPTTCICFQP